MANGDNRKSELASGAQSDLPCEDAQNAGVLPAPAARQTGGTGRVTGELPIFPMIIPDFINWDPQTFAPTPVPNLTDRLGRKKPASVEPRDLWLGVIRLALVTQSRNPVVVPLPVVGALLWGGDRSNWPKNWSRVLLPQEAITHEPGQTRQEKARHTRLQRAAATANALTCPTYCPLHGTRQHTHRFVTLDSSLGRVRQLRCGKNPDGSDRYDLTNAYTKDEAAQLQKKLANEIADYREYRRVLIAEGDAGVAENERETRKLQQQLRRAREGGRKVDGLRPVYLPARVFAIMPRVGLTPAQRNLFIALSLELTRGARRNGRPDQADVFTRGDRICPLLDPSASHVGFNGNGSGARARLRGHGYKPAAWMKKAAYPADAPVGELIRDLAALAGTFGLTVTAYRKADGAWLDLEELNAAARTADGRKRLAGCLVRVYTPADYLSRWRALFAQKLGFARIPENANDLPGAGPVSVPDAPGTIATSRQLAAWMRKERLTDGQLAERLGVSRPCVAQYRTGGRRMGPAFLGRLARYTGHSASSECNVPVTPDGAGVTVESLGVVPAVRENAVNPGSCTPDRTTT